MSASKATIAIPATPEESLSFVLIQSDGRDENPNWRLDCRP